MNTKTRLGLDIGTQSIGWCLFKGDSIIDIGVRIFPTGRDPKSEVSLAVARREAKSASRRRDRYLRRRANLSNELVRRGLLPADITQGQKLHLEDPYELRSQALDTALAPHQIGRALFHLNQRRGFQSNRKVDRVDGDVESGKIATATKALDDAMRADGSRTLGEFLFRREARRVRMKPDNTGYDFYPDRKHYLEEFEAIWTKQAHYHPDLLTDDAKATIHHIIFYQRPLKPQQVGKCSFAGWYGIPEDEERLPKAHPLFQQRRLYEEVNQLEIVSAGALSRKLTLEERDLLILKLQDKKKVTFKTLGRTLKLSADERFNKETENRKELIGDEVRATMGAKSLFGGLWPTLSYEEQCLIIETLQNEESTEALLLWLSTEYSLDQATTETIANTRLPEGHGRFGITATQRLLDALKADVVTYAEAAQRAGFHHSDRRDGSYYDILPYYGEVLAREIAPGKENYGDPLERQWGKITNPTVHIGLNQLRHIMNAIIRKHGRPDEIYVELARELNLNEKQKAAHNKRIRDTTNAAIARGQKLEESGYHNNGANRNLLRVWEELNPSNPLDRRCPYCSETISIDMLMNGSAEVDHIIPYSRCLDDGIANKIVAHTRCNRAKSNKTPWEKWGETAQWPIIQEQVSRLHKNKQWRFSPDAMDRIERNGGFVARQLTDTQYLSRIAAKYLASLYPAQGTRHVYTVTGRMTSMLRRLWGLNEILPDHNWVANPHSDAPKNRLDHRHHAIDAAIVGSTTPAIINSIARAAGRAEAQELERLFVDLEQPWPGFREELAERLRSVTISFKPDHSSKRKSGTTTGRLHNDTAYGLTGATNAQGTPIVVTRKPLLSLQPKDLTNPERIPNKDLQDALIAATRNTSGKEFENALRKFSSREGPFKGIRRIRLTEALNVIPIKDKNGRTYKAFKGDANARFDVWRLPDGKWVTKWKTNEGRNHSSIISMFDAHQPQHQTARPHPAAKKVLSLHQNDLIAVERDGGEREILRVVKFSLNGSMQLAHHQESGSLKSRDSDKDDPFKYINTSASGLKKMKARQIRIDAIGKIYDPGPRD